MRPTAARLLLLNGPSAYRRLASIVAGVALGTAMLLILLGAYLHMPERDDRAAWQDDSVAVDHAGGETAVPELSNDSVLISTHVDYFLAGTYKVVTVAASDHTTVALPSGLALPAPGEYYASPALADDIASHPADLLADRFGTSLGEIPDSMLKGPSERVVVVGESTNVLAQDLNAGVVHGFRTTGHNGASPMYRTLLAVGAIAVLVPIVLLISIVSHLGASERRERLATVRLIGAGRRAVAWLSGVEMGAASLVGGVLGIGLAALLRPLASTLTINGTTSFGSDLTPSVRWTTFAVVGIGLLGGATAWWRTYRDNVGALGASRERAEKPVTAWRTTTLVLGLAMLVGPAATVKYAATAPDYMFYVMVLGFAVTAFGIVAAGPWITRVASRMYGRFTGSASGVVAAGRLSRHPRATFRSVAGLVVAVFIVSVFAGVVSSIERVASAQAVPGALSLDAVMVSLDGGNEAKAVVDGLQGLQSVERVAVAYAAPGADDWREIMTADDARAIGAVDVPDAPAVLVDLYAMLSGSIFIIGEGIDRPEATAAIDALEASRVVVVTDGDPASKERVRTAIERAGHFGLAPVTVADYASLGTLTLTHELEVMAYIGMALAIGISALSLTVATVAAALDRKRTFALLRLGGMPAAHLRRIVTAEAIVPLAATLVASAGLGFFVAWVMIGTLGNDLTMGWPDGRYALAIAASVAIAAIAVTGSFGMVRRSTEVTSTRFE